MTNHGKQFHINFVFISMKTATITILLSVFFLGCEDQQKGTMQMDNKPQKTYNTEHLKQATFAAGCFWGVEDKFQKLDGVADAVSGYTGGHAKNPTYHQVCTGTTGHAEAVLVTYDPNAISYDKLLDTFWNMHNPTTMNRQGPDIGSQYRSAIFYHDDQQKSAAEKSLENLQNSGKYKQKIVTEIQPATQFYKAEEYHQDYFKKHKGLYCH